jgi:hypothetical protein
VFVKELIEQLQKFNPSMKVESITRKKDDYGVVYGFIEQIVKATDTKVQIFSLQE